MRRADRLFQIVQYLRGGRLVKASELAERLEVSTRTIYRDVADLIGSGVPVEGEAGVGYVMRAGYDVPPLMFTRSELVALVAGARLVRAWGGSQMARGAEEALEKIRAVLPDDLAAQARKMEVHAISFVGPDAATRERIDLLEEAAEDRTRVLLTYRDLEEAETSRHVRPLALAFWGKVWTLIAWCELREDFRMFRVDRITRCEPDGNFRLESGKRLTDFFRQEAERDRGRLF